MNMPTWQRELENFIGIKPLFVLEGNVSDLYPWDCEGQTQFLPLAHILPELFHRWEIDLKIITAWKILYFGILINTDQIVLADNDLFNFFVTHSVQKVRLIG